MSFSEVFHVRFLTSQQCANALNDNDALFLHFFSHWIFRVLTRHVFVMVFVQGWVLRIPQLENWWAHTIYVMMGFHRICHDGVYIKGLHVRLYWLMKRWLPSYTCVSCVFLYIVFRDWIRKTGSIYDFYTSLFWNQEREDGYGNSW
jgi:hypothetical protein